MYLKQSDNWQLIVHWFPRAAEAGLRPVIATFSEFLRDREEKHVDWYLPHEFLFAHPPLRADFLQLVRQTPWAQNSWGDSLVKLLAPEANNPWPILSDCHKAGEVEIKDAQGRVVGKIEVRRAWCYQNDSQRVPLILTTTIESFVKRRIKDPARKAQALEWIRRPMGDFEYRMNERALEIAAAEQCPLHAMPEPIPLQAVEDVLTKAGLIITKK